MYFVYYIMYFIGKWQLYKSECRFYFAHKNMFEVLTYNESFLQFYVAVTIYIITYFPISKP